MSHSFELERLRCLPRRPAPEVWELTIGPLRAVVSTYAIEQGFRGTLPDLQACVVMSCDGRHGCTDSMHGHRLPPTAGRTALVDLALETNSYKQATGFLPASIAIGPLPEPQRSRLLEDLADLEIPVHELPSVERAEAYLRNMCIACPPPKGWRPPRNDPGATAKPVREAATKPAPKPAPPSTDPDADRLAAASLSLQELFRKMDAQIVEQVGADGLQEVLGRLGAKSDRARSRAATLHGIGGPSASAAPQPAIPSIMAMRGVSPRRLQEFASATRSLRRAMVALEESDVIGPTPDTWAIEPMPRRRGHRFVTIRNHPSRGASLLLAPSVEAAWELAADVPSLDEVPPSRWGRDEVGWSLGLVSSTQLDPAEATLVEDLGEWTPDRDLLPAAIGMEAKRFLRPGIMMLRFFTAVVQEATIQLVSFLPDQSPPPGRDPWPTARTMDEVGRRRFSALTPVD